jgi:hypothetical protein
LSQGITPKTKLLSSLAVLGFSAEIRWKPVSGPGRGTGVWKDQLTPHERHFSADFDDLPC